MPSNNVAMSVADTTVPRHFPYPVWFEKATVLSDQVSHPRRCNGNKAAVLPTLPQATQDWTERTVGISGLARFHVVEDVLDIEKDDCAAGDKQRDPGRMHGAALPGMSDEQAREPYDRE